MKTWLKILRRSKTMIAAAALAAFGVLQQYQEQLAALLIDPTHRTLFIVGVAVLMAALRAVTTEPLKSKGEDAPK
jgi:hypothetical protein